MDQGLSKSSRKLLRTYKKLFDRLSAYNQGNNAQDGIKKAVTSMNDGNMQVTDTENTRLSIKDGKVIIDTDRGIFDGVDRKDYGRTVRTYMRTHFRGKRVSDMVFTKISEREYTASKYTQGIYSSEDGIYEAKMQASTELDKIVSAGKFIGHEDAKHPHNHNGNGYDRFEVIFNLDGEDFRGEMLIAIDKDDRRTFYDIVNIKRSATDRAADIADHDGSASVEKQHISQPTNAEALIRTPEARSSMETVPTDSITDPAENVNRNSEISSDERYALPETNSEENGADQDRYSYDTLIKKDDLSVVTLPDEVPMTEGGRIDRKSVVARGRLNAKSKNNSKNTPTETYVFVSDIDTDVLVRRDGLEHGLSRNDESTALATMHIGNLLQNSVAMNELNGRTKGKRATDMSYVLLAVGQNKNSPYLVSMIVDKTTNTVSEISTYGLYAIKAKKEGALFMPKGNEAVGDNRSYPYLRSTISIADFLQYVKSVPEELFQKISVTPYRTRILTTYFTVTRKKRIPRKENLLTLRPL